MLYQHVCLITTCMPGAHRGYKRASGLLELEIGKVVSRFVSSGSATCVLNC